MMDREPIKNHMDTGSQENHEDEIKGPVPDGESDHLSCPAGFPPDKWARKTEGYRKNYLRVVVENKKATGGQ